MGAGAAVPHPSLTGLSPPPLSILASRSDDARTCSSCRRNGNGGALCRARIFRRRSFGANRARDMLPQQGHVPATARGRAPPEPHYVRLVVCDRQSGRWARRKCDKRALPTKGIQQGQRSRGSRGAERGALARFPVSSDGEREAQC